MVTSRSLWFRRPLTLFIGSFALVVLLFLVTAFWLLASETGSRWLINTALHSAPAIKVGKVKGTLLKELSLQNISYRESDQFTTAIGELSLRWHPLGLLQRRLHIAHLRASGINVTGKPAEDAEQDQQPVTIPNIPLHVRIDELAVHRVKWQQADNTSIIEHFTAAAELHTQTLMLKKVQFSMPDVSVSARAEVKLQPDWPVNGSVDWQYQQPQAPLKGRLDLNGNMQSLEFKSLVSGPVNSEQSGTVNLSAESPQFDLQGKWTKLQWPLQGQADYKSQQGAFSMNGTVDDYQLDIHTHVVIAENSPIKFELIGQGNSERFNIQHLHVFPESGSATLSGQVKWVPAIQSELALKLTNLDIQKLGINDVPAIISGNLNASLALHDQKTEGNVQINALTGTLYQQPLQANGNINWHNNDYHFDNLLLQAGRNTLIINGRTDPQSMQLTGNLNANDLSTAWPEFGGSLVGQLELSGNKDKPVINANLEGKHLNILDYHLDQLNISADYFHAENKLSKVSLNARGLSANGQQINLITLNGQGYQNDHSLTLSLGSPMLDVSMTAAGNWQAPRWQGVVKTLELNHPQLAKWQTSDPVDLSVVQKQNKMDFRLSAACLNQGQSKLCLQAMGDSAKDWHANYSLQQLDWQSLQAWLPKTLKIDGTLSASGEAKMKRGQLDAVITANSTASQINIQQEELNKNLVLEQLSFDAKYSDNRLNSQIVIRQQENNAIEMNLEMTGLTNKLPGIFGSIKANIQDLTLVDSLLPQIKDVEGKFVSEMQISGNTSKPLLTGQSRLYDAGFTLPQLGISLSEIELTANSSPQSPEELALELIMSSGDGQLSGQGQFKLNAEHGFPFEMNLAGEQFQIAQIPEAEIEISPNIQIIRDHRQTNVTGKLDVDKAILTIENLPENAVVPSQDEVIVSNESKENKASLSSEILNVDMAIILGESVSFEGFGLNTFLRGKLNYVANPERTAMFGKTELYDATYTAYGQDLELRKGEFVFNGPSDNPWMTIEAERKANTEDVTAVLQVSGLLQSPTTRVFSEPSLPETEALSYLLTGQSMKSLGKSESGSVAAAAFNYGAGHLSWITDMVGIDDFEFDGGDKIEDSSVKLGHYLNPDLYVGFTMGLFSNKYVANMQYRLNRYFSLHTQAGETQRIELKYQLQTD